jgi:hypothetical protein
VHLRGTALDIGGMDGEKRRGEVCVCGRHTWLERYMMSLEATSIFPQRGRDVAAQRR